MSKKISSLFQKIQAAEKRSVTREIEIGDEKFNIGVKLISINEFDTAEKNLTSSDDAKIVGVLSDMLFDPETGLPIFDAENVKNFTLQTLAKFSRLIIDANTGRDDKQKN